jgi:hypothetical protein
MFVLSNVMMAVRKKTAFTIHLVTEMLLDHHGNVMTSPSRGS